MFDQRSFDIRSFDSRSWLIDAADAVKRIIRLRSRFTKFTALQSFVLKTVQLVSKR